MRETLDQALRQLKAQGGSDLYIEAGAPLMMRRDGQLHPAGRTPLSPDFVRSLLRSLLTQQQWQQFMQELELNFAYAIQGVGRFRVNAFVQRGSPGMVIRAIRNEIPRPEMLGLPRHLCELMHRPHGLILFVGATGVGKSTSLASLVDFRNRTRSGHIITIEDPIEFTHEHKKCLITQREVGIDTHSFQSALKNALRQAPDVIVIGEIRDRDTMEHALNFAETGHLCLSTLHANNAYQALERIANFFPREKQEQVMMDLAFNLRAIVSQRLVPRIGGGRIAVFEILLQTPRVQDLIFRQEIETLKSVMEEQRDRGMQSFDQHLVELCENGEISYETAIRYADSATNVRLRLRGYGRADASPPPETLPPEGTEPLLDLEI